MGRVCPVHHRTAAAVAVVEQAARSYSHTAAHCHSQIAQVLCLMEAAARAAGAAAAAAGAAAAAVEKKELSMGQTWGLLVVYHPLIQRVDHLFTAKLHGFMIQSLLQQSPLILKDP
jgi:predicted alpha/beta hydrolase